MLARLVLNSWPQVICPPWSSKMLGLQARVTTHGLEAILWGEGKAEPLALGPLALQNTSALVIVLIIEFLRFHLSWLSLFQKVLENVCTYNTFPFIDCKLFGLKNINF